MNFACISAHSRGAALAASWPGQLGDEAEIDGLELKVNCRLKRELVEGYSEIEDLAHAGTFDDQKHRVGPVAYYETGGHEGKPEWEFAAGALFGVSDATSDLTFKFDAEVKF